MLKLNEEMLLILNTIIYSEHFLDELLQLKTILDWANSYDVARREYTAEMIPEEIAKVVALIKANPEVYGNMKIRDVTNTTFEDSNDEVTSATIEYGNNVIIVYKGTGGDMEWEDNARGVHSNTTDTPQQRDALAYFDDHTKNYTDGRNIYVTGHSKGGNKAQYVTILRGDQITHAYSFDGQGFGKYFVKKYQAAINKHRDKITSISNAFDFVNILLTPIAKNEKFIKSTTTFGGGNPLMRKYGAWHSPYSMFAQNSNELLKLNIEVEQSEMMKQLKAYLDYLVKYMREDDLRYTIELITNALQTENSSNFREPKGFKSRLIKLTKTYISKNAGVDLGDVMIFLKQNTLMLSPVSDVVTAFGGGLYWIFDAFVASEPYVDTLRDFSQETKNKLLSLTKEVSEETMWDVTKWDIFYRVEKLIGGLDFPKNSEALNGYYRKIIDIQGVTEQKIYHIFDAVYAEDARFAGEIAAVAEQASAIRSHIKVLSDGFS